MEQENAALFEQMVGRFHIRRVIRAADVFHHADTDDAVKFEPFILKVAVVNEVNRHEVLEALRLDAFLTLFPLLFAECAAIALDAVFFAASMSRKPQPQPISSSDMPCLR